MPRQLLKSLTISFATVPRVAVLALAGMATGSCMAQGMPYGSVKSWQVTSSVEVTKSEVFDDRTESWSFKASGKALIDSTMPEGMRFQWGTPSFAGGMPNADNAYNGKGTMEFKYQATHKRVSASAPGGTVVCEKTGEIPYNSMIMAMPGQPVAGGAQPILGGEVKCTRSAGMIDGPSSVPLTMPTVCDGSFPKAAARQLTQTTTCEAQGFKITYRFQADALGR